MMIEEPAYPLVMIPNFFEEFFDEIFDEDGQVLEGLDSNAIELQNNKLKTKLEYTKNLLFSEKGEGKVMSDAVVKKGFMEQIFYRFLKLNSPYTICTSTMFGYSYSPDLLIVDPVSNLMIDIEIDEPYSYTDGTPIHFYESGFEKEARRDKYFTKIGIMVIRFAEEQVVKYPQACLDFINGIVRCVNETKGYLVDDIYNSWNNWKGDMCVCRWRIEEAIEMAKYNYRNTYLPTKYLQDYESMFDQFVEEVIHPVKDISYDERNKTDIFSIFKTAKQLSTEAVVLVPNPDYNHIDMKTLSEIINAALQAKSDHT